MKQAEEVDNTLEQVISKFAQHEAKTTTKKVADETYTQMVVDEAEESITAQISKKQIEHEKKVAEEYKGKEEEDDQKFGKKFTRKRCRYDGFDYSDDEVDKKREKKNDDLEYFVESPKEHESPIMVVPIQMVMHDAEPDMNEPRIEALDDQPNKMITLKLMKVLKMI